MRNRRTTRRMLLAVLSCALMLPLAFPAPASAILRGDVISRAEVWVAKRTPYSQSRFARVDGSLVATSVSSPHRVGYRTDCSGYVSMCLGLTNSDDTPLSLSTATLPTKLTKITKEQLKPGDVILRPKDLVVSGKVVPYGHAVIFGGWTDAKKTSYVGYDESSSSGRTVKRVIPYPFWDAVGFSPYRYKSIEEIRPKKSRPKVGYKLDPLTGRMVRIGS